MNYEKKIKRIGSKKNYFSKKFASVFFLDKKIPMLAVVVTTIAIVILYLEKG